MKRTVVAWGLSALMSGLVVLPALVQLDGATYAAGDAAGLMEPAPTPGPPGFKARIGGHGTTEGPGYDTNFGVNAFIPLTQSRGRNLTFLQARLFGTKESTEGGSVMLGHRFLSGGDRVFGGYISYDRRNTFGGDFDQIGLGLDGNFGNGLDLRLNGYLPIGDKSAVVSSTPTGNTFFQGNTLQLQRLTQYSSALQGFDAEVGKEFKTFGNNNEGSLRGFLGLYHYDGDFVDSFTGFRGGISAQYRDNVRFGVEYFNDDVFDDKVLFRIDISTSGINRRQAAAVNPLLERLDDDVQRNNYMTIATPQVLEAEAARNSLNNNPFNFRFVNLGAAGNGTFENPSGTVQQALTGAGPNVIVYVQPGSNPGIPGFIIPEGVSVISSAVPQTVTTSQAGQVALPGSGSGARPLITDNVILNSSTTLSGFELRNTSGAAVQGDDINTVNINGNVIASPGLEGIFLNNVTGNVRIANNTISDVQGILGPPIGLTTPPTPAEITAGGELFTDTHFNSDLRLAGGVSGIRLFNDAGNTTLALTGNSVTNANNNGITIGSAGSAEISGLVEGNNSSNNIGSGILPFFTDTSEMNLTFRNNTLNNNQGRIINESGIRFAGFGAARGTAAIENNTVNGNRGNGIFVGSNNASVVTATVNGNTTEGNLGNGIFAGTRDGSQMNVTISGNTANNTGSDPALIPPPFPRGNGILIGTLEGGQMTANVNNNVTNGNTVHGIHLFATGAGSANVNFSGNNAANNQQNGIALDIGPAVGPPPPLGPPPSTVQVTATVANNVVSDSGNSGIGAVATNGTATLALNGNTVSGSRNNGILVQSSPNTQIDVQANNNTVRNNVGSGIFFFLNGGQVTANIAGNTATGNQARSPQEAGIRFGVFGNSIGNVTLSNNTATDNMGNGLFVGAQDASQVTAVVQGNTVLNNRGNGIFLGAQNDAVVQGTVTGNTSNGNQVNSAFAPFPTGSGIFIGSQGNGQNTTTVSNNTVSGNGDIGIFAFVGDNASATVDILDNTSLNNTRNGIEVNAGLVGGPGNPAPPGFAPQAIATIRGNTVSGNMGIGPPLGGGGIFALSFNRALVRAVIENNQVTGNATTPGSFGGVALVAVQNARIEAGVRNNTITGNGGANPGFNALSGVPPTVLGGALAGPAELFLSLTNNISDQAYVLLRPPGTTLAAETSGNVGGPIVTPATPVDPLPPGSTP